VSFNRLILFEVSQTKKGVAGEFGFVASACQFLLSVAHGYGI
jgi:hypothetical protein